MVGVAEVRGDRRQVGSRLLTDALGRLLQPAATDDLPGLIPTCVLAKRCRVRTDAPSRAARSSTRSREGSLSASSTRRRAGTASGSAATAAPTCVASQTSSSRAAAVCRSSASPGPSMTRVTSAWRRVAPFVSVSRSRSVPTSPTSAWAAPGRSRAPTAQPRPVRSRRQARETGPYTRTASASTTSWPAGKGSVSASCTAPSGRSHSGTQNHRARGSPSAVGRIRETGARASGRSWPLRGIASLTGRA